MSIIRMNSIMPAAPAGVAIFALGIGASAAS